MITENDDIEIAQSELRKMKLAGIIRKRQPAKKKIASPAGLESPFMKMADILELIPVGRSTIYMMIQEGRFPKGINLGPNTVVWSKKTVEAWIAEKLGA